MEGMLFGVAMYIAEPPARYDHPFRGKLTTQYAPRAEITRRCMNAMVWGCAFPSNQGRCTVLILERLPENMRAQAHRHEVGHCNGWPRDHRG